VSIQLLRGLHNPGMQPHEPSGKCVATIGNFDGVHLGHQAIILQLIAEAKKRGLPSLVVIFEPQPMEFFKGKESPPRLMCFREKFQALSEFNIDYVFCLKFDADLSQLSAQEFIQKVLLSHLKIDHLVIGDDFRFGGDRLGDYSLLVDSGRENNFTVENTPTVLCESKKSLGKGVRVSSTYVRQLLHEGEFSLVQKVLGRPYEMAGRVIHGEKLGRQLGFPTANISIKRINAPFSGVFAVSLSFESGTSYQGVANLGVKPTVGNFKPSLEVYLLDFDGDIYGKKVSVHFRHKIRQERKFDGIEDLKVQIEKDVEHAKRYFNSLDS